MKHTSINCNDCNQSGKIKGKECPRCNGRGVIVSIKDE